MQLRLELRDVGDKTKQGNDLGNQNYVYNGMAGKYRTARHLKGGWGRFVKLDNKAFNLVY